MKKLFVGILMVMVGFIGTSIAHEACDDLLNYEKEFVCPKSKDPKKCLKEAYFEYGKCVESMKNYVQPEPEPDKCEVECETVRQPRYDYCIECIDNDEVPWLWGYKEGMNKKKFCDRIADSEVTQCIKSCYKEKYKGTVDIFDVPDDLDDLK